MTAAVEVQSALAEARRVVHARTSIYTQDPVVEALLDELAWPQNDGRLIEPSCGDGAFLDAALARLIAYAPRLTWNDIVRRLEGWEIDEVAVRTARGKLARRLALAGYDAEVAHAAAERIVREGDFLTEGPTEAGAYQAVAGNPPYLAKGRVPAALRAVYALVVPEHARADLLHAFIERCARLLTPDGELGFVTPERWLTNENSARLRQEVGRAFALHAARELDERTAFRRPKVRKADTPPRIDPYAIVLRKPGPGSVPLTHAPVYPRALHSTHHTGVPLGRVATVRLAPYLGKLGVFLLRREDAAHLPQERLMPAVDAHTIGEPPEATTLVALRTTRGDEPPQAIRRHLQHAKQHVRQRNLDLGVPPEPFHKWDLARPCLVIPCIQKEFEPVRLPAGVLPVTHGLNVVQGRDDAHLNRIEAALRTPDARAWANARGDRLESGFLRIKTNVLKNLPVSVSPE